jgi:hypothetical protein
MSTPAQEQAFYDAVIAAEGVRQGSKAAAQVTYGFVKANYAAFVTALVAADTTYFTSVAAAATTAGMNPNVGLSGPIPVARWSKLGGH